MDRRYEVSLIDPDEYSLPTDKVSERVTLDQACSGYVASRDFSPNEQIMYIAKPLSLVLTEMNYTSKSDQSLNQCLANSV